MTAFKNFILKVLGIKKLKVRVDKPVVDNIDYWKTYYFTIGFLYNHTNKSREQICRSKIEGLETINKLLKGVIIFNNKKYILRKYNKELYNEIINVEVIPDKYILDFIKGCFYPSAQIKDGYALHHVNNSKKINIIKHQIEKLFDYTPKIYDSNGGKQIISIFRKDVSDAVLLKDDFSIFKKEYHTETKDPKQKDYYFFTGSVYSRPPIKVGNTYKIYRSYSFLVLLFNIIEDKISQCVLTNSYFEIKDTAFMESVLNINTEEIPNNYKIDFIRGCFYPKRQDVKNCRILYSSATESKVKTIVQMVEEVFNYTPTVRKQGDNYSIIISKKHIVNKILEIDGNKK
jgi:hypothetical protein